ncbi:hypothetical protein MTR67_033646 [Solanum verrucosum]|uniref:Uncharacterized protein n=1 Tax=Solanum verrucosum TaxID=315347 RepID=A0AAF0ZHN5_SOLVR|nr:hypothetical protein MTR67_033646 [Solanum verrucosum]
MGISHSYKLGIAQNRRC